MSVSKNFGMLRITLSKITGTEYRLSLKWIQDEDEKWEWDFYKKQTNEIITQVNFFPSKSVLLHCNYHLTDGWTYGHSLL